MTSGNSFLAQVGNWRAPLVVAAITLGCGPSLEEQGPPPVPALADSGSAQRAFRDLKERWQTSGSEQQPQLVAEFRRFLATYPEDDQTRLGRVYLAWLLVNTGELAEARELIEVTRRGPPGAAADFAQVVEGALLVRHNQPHEALKLLRPLQGKLIDPVEAFYATQQLVRSAMAANLYAEALSHVVDWLLQANPMQRPPVRVEVKAMVGRVPRRYLERALETERPLSGEEAAAAPQRVTEQQWFYDVLTAQLGAIAVAQTDRELARRVLAESPALETDSEEPSELLRLATGVSESAAVVEKTVGFVLNTRSAVGRRRSNQVVSALTQSLELLAKLDDGDAGSNGPGKPVEPAARRKAAQPDAETSEVERRRAKRKLDVVITDDATDLEHGLAELAARGAPLLLTGMTEEDATAAARFAARERIPVVLFLPPRVTTNYAFVLGVGDSEQQRLAGDGIDPDAALVTELECEVAAESTGVSGFPMAEWASEGRRSLYLLGDAACSKRALNQLRRSKFKADVWFGLESAHLWPGESVPDFHTLLAGRFPFAAGSLPQATELAQRLGHQPTWYETLGRDAAVLLEEVFAELPEVQLQDDEEVARYHARVLQRLKTFASKDLWSSSDARFDDGMRLERTLAWQ